LSGKGGLKRHPQEAVDLPEKRETQKRNLLEKRKAEKKIQEQNIWFAQSTEVGGMKAEAVEMTKVLHRGK